VQLKREGFPLIAHTAEYVTIPFSGLGTTVERIKSNRPQIKRLLKAEIEALRYIQANAPGTTEVIRKRFNMEEKLARESYDVVVNAFSRDGRVPLKGVDILLQIEKDQKLIPATITPKNGRRAVTGGRSLKRTRRPIAEESFHHEDPARRSRNQKRNRTFTTKVAKSTKFGVKY
jgi:hypothetical protein